MFNLKNNSHLLDELHIFFVLLAQIHLSIRDKPVRLNLLNPDRFSTRFSRFLLILVTFLVRFSAQHTSIEKRIQRNL